MGGDKEAVMSQKSDRKVITKSQLNVEREALLKRLEEGVVIEGIVKNLNGYGAVLDLGGVDGLLHITDMAWAWRRIKHPSELLSPGDEIQVKVLEYDKEKKRVWLGLKQLSEDPWVGVETRYPPGTRVTGKVTKIADNWCLVEIAEGIKGLLHISNMAWRQIKHPSELLSLGDKIQVQVLKYDKEKKRVSLGLKQLGEGPWVGVETRYPPGTRITGKVTNKEKKRVSLGLKQLGEDPWVGVETRYPPGTRTTGKVMKIFEKACLVEIEEGIHGFLHINNMAWRWIKHPSELLSLGDEIQVQVLEYDKEKKRVSLGLKQLSEDPWVGVENRYPPGTRTTGKVTNIADDRCFVEIEEGIEGVVHISNMAWRRIKHPSELLFKGDEIQVQVLEYNKEKKRVSLGLKQLSEDPWVGVENRYPPGTRTTGKVMNIVDYGCFVEIEEGINGLLHISDMAWRQIKHPSELLSLGDEIQVQVLEYNKEKKWVSLGLKQLDEGPWVGFVTRHPPGTRITCKVTNIADDRCFVEIEEGIEGVVHISNMAWRRIKHPSELLSRGDEIQVKVLEYDKEKKRVWLGLKQLSEDPWVGVETRYPPGTRTTGKVMNIVDHGCFVEIEEGINGLLHISNMAWRRIKHPSELLSPGDEIQVQVLRYNKEKKRVWLGLKQLDEGPWVGFVTRYPPGKRVTGKVTKIAYDWCFVEIEEGIEGVVHIDDMAWRRIKHPSELLSPGDEIQVKVLEYDKEKKWVSLGLKQLSEDPWVGVETRYPPGTRTTGKVTKIISNWCSVEIEEGIEGFLHISDMAWRQIKHFSLGDEIQVQVLRYDKEKKRVWLGDPWVGVETRYPPWTQTTGKVTDIAENGCSVEIEEGIEGVVHIDDMAWRRIKHPSELLSLGDEIQVQVLKYDKEKKQVWLGLKQLDEGSWAGFETRYPPGTRVTGKVTKIAKKACRVEIEEGFDGLLHIDNMAWKRIKHPSELLSIGDEIQVRVLEYDKEKKRVWLGLKQLSEDPWVGVETRYPPGTQTTGKVMNIVGYGCLVEIEEGIEGLLHITNMACRWIKHPSELLSIGDEIQVKVLEYDKEKKRVSLGLKQLGEDPWVGVETRYPPGTRVTGKVTNIVDYGCFVEIEEGINGLLHITDMVWAWRQIKHPSELLSIGDEIQVKVLEYDKEKKRVSLGLKQLGEDPWVGVENRYPPGTRITGKVTKIAEYWCFVEIAEGIEGVVHISNMAWRRIKHPSELLSVGDEIQVKVLEYDKEKKRMSLGLKQLGEDLWVGFETRYPLGARVTGKVTSIADDRCFVEIEEGIEGVVNITDMAWRRIKHPSELLSIGDETKVKVLKYDKEKKQVWLGLKQLGEDPWVEVETRYPPGTRTTGKVTKITKHGCSVEIEEGVEGLVNISDMAWAWRRIKHPSELLSIGDETQVKVLKYDKEKKQVWLGLKQLGEDPWVGVETRYPPGTRTTGKVTHINNRECFVEIGEGIEGVVHVSNMAWAWRRIKHPSELLSIGDEIQVKVLEYDKEKKRVSLGLKQLGEDPWVGVETRYPPRTRITGKVTNIADYGCFVEIEEGIEGLVHVSEMSWTSKHVHPEKIVSLGADVEVIVLAIDDKRRRISLGIKQCQLNPWEEFASQYKKGDKVNGRVKSLTDFGIFIGIDGFDLDGLVHMSDISWADSNEESIRKYKKGDQVTAVIASVDVERERISLDIKQLEENPIGNYLSTYSKGDIVKGKVQAVDEKTVTLELAKNVKGVIPAGEFSGEGATPAEGDEIEAKFVDFDKKRYVLELSVRGKEREEQKKVIASYAAHQTQATEPLGSIVKDKLREEDAH